MPSAVAFSVKPRMVQIERRPCTEPTMRSFPDGAAFNPSAARCSSVSSEHGSTPSRRISRAQGAAPVGADGVPATTVVHPAASTAVTRRRETHQRR